MSEDISNIDIDLTGTDISRPLLPKQRLLCAIGDVKVEKQEGRGRNLVVPLTLEEPGADTKGKPVNVGFVVVDRILIDPTGGLTQEMINERLARLQAAAMKAAPGRFNSEAIAALSGKKVMVTFNTRPDKEDPNRLYQDIKRYDPVKE